MKQFKRTITVLPVRAIEAACEWYAQTLGLMTRYKHEGSREDEETNYAILERDGVQVHLILDEPPPYAKPWTKAGTGYLYLRVQDIESLHHEMQAKEIPLESTLETSNWGATGFEICDLDGNHIRLEQMK